jgi:uncharacterized protein with NRDE domain
MCLIVFAWRPDHPHPLIVAANRDEFYQRPTLPLGPWPDGSIRAGRDLQAGGTWLGVGPAGRFAALTNIRDPAQPPGRRSRGELPVQFLAGTATADAFLTGLALRLGHYAGFNLLLGTPGELWHFNSRAGEPTRLAPGVYGLSNAGLDTPWPKLLRARTALENRLDRAGSDELLALLRDDCPAADAELPDTGVGIATERLLSSVFIASERYGTRASTTLITDAGGGCEMVERSFGAFGEPLGEVRLRL